jgi:hypothetical protein
MQTEPFPALKARDPKTDRRQVDLSFNFRLFVIPAEAGIQNENWREKISGYPLSRV